MPLGGRSYSPIFTLEQKHIKIFYITDKDPIPSPVLEEERLLPKANFHPFHLFPASSLSARNALPL